MSLDSYHHEPQVPFVTDDGETEWYEIDSSIKLVSTTPGLALGIAESTEYYSWSFHKDTYSSSALKDD